MACNYPIAAYKYRDGGIGFDECKGDVVQFLRLPCGVCTGCRLERSRQWAVRCLHEASLHEENCFITLTYNDEHLTAYEDLCYKDFQDFMKRLRKKFSHKKIRFFMCGEYGENNGRPHYHACLFGHNFDDRIHLKVTSSGSKISTSKTLDDLWSDRNNNPIGFCTVGDVNFDSAGYVARYLMKKGLGRGHESQYQEIDMETGEVYQKQREFNKMSLKPGLGHGFYKKWTKDIFPKDVCIVNGRETKPPRYYAKKFKDDDPESYEELQYLRYQRSLQSLLDNTEERLKVKEHVLKAKVKLLKRELEGR